MKILAIALIGSALAISAAAANDAPQASRPANAERYYGLYQNPSQALAAPGADDDAFDDSGTRGRQGLGASPFHPEGPGNVND